MNDPLDSPPRTPLSFAQQEGWLHAQLAGDLPVGNETITIHRQGPLDVSALEQALGEIVRRHEAWRTTVRTDDDGQPVLVVIPPSAVRLPLVDLRGQADAERTAQALAREDAVRRFDLARGPLWRARLVQLADGEHRLFLTIHQLVADRASIARRILPELATLYAGAVGSHPSSAERPGQYGEFAAWQHEWMETPAAAAQLDHWRRKLAGPPPIVEIPTDRARPRTRAFRGASQGLALGGPLTEACRRSSRETAAPLFATLLAGFAALLQRYTGEEDLTVGTMARQGSSPATREAFGCFENPLALRVDLSGDPSFRALVDRVREVVGNAFDHADLPFQAVVGAVQPVRDRARHPLFSNVFTLEPAWPEPPPGWRVTTGDVDGGVARFDLEVELREGAEGVGGHIFYRTDLFEAGTVTRLAAHYRTLLAAAIAEPDRPVSELPLLDARERQRVVEWNRTARPYPEATIPELFQRQVARAPEAVAVVAGDASLTYGELARRAGALAGRLRALGIGRGAMVGVAMERSPEVIVSYLGILEVGAAYLPLSLNDPPDRLAYMVADAGASVVLVRRGTAGRVVVPDIRVVEVGLDADREVTGPRPAPGVPGGTPDDRVYVIYTSGSTGRPKGVAVPHRGVVRLVFNQDYVHLGPEEVILQATALSFDVSAFEIWGALLHGARLVLYPSAVPTTREVGEVIRRHGITTTWLTTSIFNLVVDEDVRVLAPLRQLVVGGEALSVPHIARADQALPDTQLVNGYGPTECSVLANCYRIPRPVDPAAASIPIGPPIMNTTAHVLDRHRNPVPIGVPGELYLGGPGVAHGYLNRPELTAERFIPDPFSTEAGARLYRTGDLARWRSDGLIDYLGRLDTQVKLRGLRIELGEIESVLARHPAVRESAVVVREDGGTGKRLVAYLVARPGAAARPDELREFLKRSLPAYMVPAAFVSLPSLPLTSSGKLDRRALPAPPAVPEAAESEGGAAVEVPRDSLEGQLVELWQELLGRRPIGVTDDFFELGGDSLLAARMMQQVNDLKGTAIPLATLYESPTVERLARLITAGGPRADVTGPAVTFNRGGQRIPLFLFDGVLVGGAFYALRLARRLGPDQPIHVIHPLGVAGGAIPPTIEAMADEQLEAVRALQPRGPYRLAGYCNGGLVAYEIARRLRAAGEHVDLVALVAAVPCRAFDRTGRALQRFARRVGASPGAVVEPIARLRAFTDRLSTLGAREWPAFFAEKAVRWARRVAPRRRAPASGTDGSLTAHDLYYQVMMRYFPEPSAGSVVLLWPDRDRAGTPAEVMRAWRRLVDSARLDVIAGDHLAIVQEQVDALAAHLAAHLDGGDRSARAA